MPSRRSGASIVARSPAATTIIWTGCTYVYAAASAASVVTLETIPGYFA
jgi:hypothetical protein